MAGPGTLGEGVALLIPILLAVLAYFAAARLLGIEELGLLYGGEGNRPKSKPGMPNGEDRNANGGEAGGRSG